MHISARGVTAVASASAEDGGATAGVSDGNGDGNGDEGNDDGNGDEGNDESSQTSALSSFTTHSASSKNTSPLSPTTSTSAGGTRQVGNSCAGKFLINYTRSASSSITASIAVTPSSTAKPSSPSSTSTAQKKTASATVIGGSVAGSLIALLATGICIIFILRRHRRRLRVKSQITPLEGSPSAGGLFISEKHHMNYHSLQPVRLGHQPHVPAPVPLPESSGHRSEQLESPEGNDVRSQVASLQDSNAEMRTTIVRLMEHMQHLEAQMESEEAPPMYVPS
ncbi:hypothetical protein BT96DRAFT_1006580 [Gymnopus androsaceus JB14]|uniref:Uncharacterized protein n=1 Tax=Gymnopus androsaceus JB14 TaxID=1447944 RepID=A0A6A4GJP5_9AGAR|nr:hypothetical protein BT96DRAFT_1006580 [Gymnopus androsaceus JB14]